MKIDAATRKRIRDRPYYAYLYARNVLKGRLSASLEGVFAHDPHSACLYAMNVVCGRLPDPVHNSLLMYSLEKKDEGGHVAKYLKWLEGK
jgi:hypothetical protein